MKRDKNYPLSTSFFLSETASNYQLVNFCFTGNNYILNTYKPIGIPLRYSVKQQEQQQKNASAFMV